MPYDICIYIYHDVPGQILPKSQRKPPSPEDQWDGPQLRRFAASQLRCLCDSRCFVAVLPSPTKSYQVLPHSGPGSGGSPTRHGTVMAMDKRWQKLVHCHEDFQGKSVLPSPTVNHGEPSLPSHIHVLNDICGWLRQSPAAVLDEKFWRTTWQHPES